MGAWHLPEQRTQKGPKRMERKAENKLKIYKCHQIKCRTHTLTHTHKEPNKCARGRKNKKGKKERVEERERQSKLFKCNHLKCLKNQTEMLRKKHKKKKSKVLKCTLVYLRYTLYDIRADI